MSIEDFEIMFVDDEKVILSVIQQYFSPLGYKITLIDNGLSALELVKKKNFDIVFTDLKMPGFSGLELVSAIKDYRQETEVIIMTGFGTMESAIEALRLGSYDYIQKPIELDRLKRLIDRIIEKRTLQMENILFRRREEIEKYRYGDIIGVSRQTQEIFDVIEKVSQTDATVLVQGESGTGKELVAKVIHRNSDRCKQPFVPVNCGAIVEGLLESELFGHVKGAFSGAIRDNIGLFKAAEGGTLFLDEIAEVSPALQVKLLRVLQEKKIRPVGDSRETEVDARVIAATNRDVSEALKTGALREDLFYRLNVVSIKIPPLRERREDVPILVDHFLNVFNARKRRKVSKIAPDALEILLNYSWPGNVRQLENVIERAFALGSGETLQISDLPSEMREFVEVTKGNDHVLTLKENEIVLIRKALQRTSGDKLGAAKLLGINLATLYRKIKKYGIQTAA